MVFCISRFLGDHMHALDRLFVSEFMYELQCLLSCFVCFSLLVYLSLVIVGVLWSDFCCISGEN